MWPIMGSESNGEHKQNWEIKIYTVRLRELY